MVGCARAGVCGARGCRVGKVFEVGSLNRVWLKVLAAIAALPPVTPLLTGILGTSHCGLVAVNIVSFFRETTKQGLVPLNGSRVPLPFDGCAARIHFYANLKTKT